MGNCTISTFQVHSRSSQYLADIAFIKNSSNESAMKFSSSNVLLRQNESQGRNYGFRCVERACDNIPVRRHRCRVDAMRKTIKVGFSIKQSVEWDSLRCLERKCCVFPLSGRMKTYEIKLFAEQNTNFISFFLKKKISKHTKSCSEAQAVTSAVRHSRILLSQNHQGQLQLNAAERADTETKGIDAVGTFIYFRAVHLHSTRSLV